MRNRYNHMTCSACGRTLTGDDIVIEYDGVHLCDECFAEEVGCDPCEVREYAKDIPGAWVETAEDFLENDRCNHEDWEYQNRREEQMLAAAWV